MTRRSRDELVTYLHDAYALERVGLALLEKASLHAGSSAMARIYREQGRMTTEHKQLVGERLGAYDTMPAAQQTNVDVGGLRIDFKLEVPQTAEQLAISIFTLENLQISIYHVLITFARHCQDSDTELLARQILEQEEEAVELIADAVSRVLAD